MSAPSINDIRGTAEDLYTEAQYFWAKWVDNAGGIRKPFQATRIAVVTMLAILTTHAYLSAFIARLAGSQFSPLVAGYEFSVIIAMLLTGLLGFGPIADLFIAASLFREAKYKTVDHLDMLDHSKLRQITTIEYPWETKPVLFVASFFNVMLLISILTMFLPVAIYEFALVWYISAILMLAMLWSLNGTMSKNVDPFRMYIQIQGMAFKLLIFMILYVSIGAAVVKFAEHNPIYQGQIAPVLAPLTHQVVKSANFNYPTNIYEYDSGVDVTVGQTITVDASGCYDWRVIPYANSNEVQDHPCTSPDGAIFEGRHYRPVDIPNVGNLNAWRGPTFNAGSLVLVILGIDGKRRIYEADKHFEIRSPVTGRIGFGTNTRRALGNSGQLQIALNISE